MIEIPKKPEQPIIWKEESCLIGSCKDSRIKHRWSIPFTTPWGLTTECFDCHKTRHIEVEKSV